MMTPACSLGRQLLARLASSSLASTSVTLPEAQCSQLVVGAWSNVHDCQRRGFKQDNKPKGGASSRMKTGKKGAPQTMDEGNPRLKAVLDMLTPPEVKDMPLTAEDKARLAEYHEQWVVEGHAWIKDMTVKHKLQQAALKALPEALRRKAMLPDLTPFPPNRAYLFDTPPASYRDK
jgi:hypothetical protein